MFVEGGSTPKAEMTKLHAAPMEWIEREIGELAAHIAAATCRWLGLIAEFDRREGYAAWGFHSCGAWVAWRCSVDPRSAREHVRVARVLEELPAIRECFAKGQLSYSKVRAITRIATPDLEAELLEMTRFATAAQLESLVHGYKRAASLESAEAAHRDRFLACEWDEDGSLEIRGRLSPEDGALFIKAVEAGREALRQGGSAEPEPSGRINDADALMEVAEAALAGDSELRTDGERYQVVLHADAEALTGNDEKASCHLDDGPAICVETARRLACDSSLIPILHGPMGSLDVGRKTRAIPPSIRRALQVRDKGRCQFPGCENRRWVDAHHIVHWARGGKTKIDNLVLLCTHHHRLVHEGGFGISRRSDGSLVFRRPDGKPIPAAPTPPLGSPRKLREENRRTGVRVGSYDSMPLGRGEPFDRELAVVGLLERTGP